MRDMSILRAEARAIARQAHGLLGPLAVSRILREHHAFFRRLRRTGATWAQIALLMETEGLRSRKGEAIGPAVLRALCSRALREEGQDKPRLTDQVDAPRQECAITAKANRPPNPDFTLHRGDQSLAEIIERTARIRRLD